MRIPTVLIMVPLMFAFAMFIRQYYLADTDNRVTDHRFLLAATTVALGLGYLLLGTFGGTSPALSIAAFLASLALAGVSWLIRPRTVAKP